MEICQMTGDKHILSHFSKIMETGEQQFGCPSPGYSENRH